MSNESNYTDPGSAGQTGEPNDFRQPQRPLYRPRDQGMFTGTAAGIARYLGMDPTIVRVAFAALCLIGGAGLPLYLAAWLLIPEEGAPQSIAADLFGHARAGFGANQAA
jgi:phage shock protein PspC (stress-responsive transcriptional regulator)